MASPVARPVARTSHSPASFVSPYGDIGRQGVSSVTSLAPVDGVPYTAAEDENTKDDGTPAAVTASSRTRRPSTFTR
ncbi:hypothetical protein SHIRM173S_08034 [Streptomyces hirsutus]